MSENPFKTFFQYFRLPLTRGEEDVYTFLDEHFKDFRSKLDALLEKQENNHVFDKKVYSELQEKKFISYELSKAILQAISFYFRGDILAAHQIFEDVMDTVPSQLISSELRGYGVLDEFYRIRRDKGETYKDLFHIPLTQRELVRDCRYSIAGFPCLYLAGSKGGAGLALAWLETGKPNKFFWSEFEVVEDVPPIQMLDITWSPFSSATNAQHFYTWSLNKKEAVSEVIPKYVITYPLLAACSLKVKNRNQPFIPEYIIPQMLLLWVHNHSKYRGIKYFSASYYEEARRYNAFNVVLPPITYDKAYCSQLGKEFKLSVPDFIDVANVAGENKKALEIIIKSSKAEPTEKKFFYEKE